MALPTKQGESTYPRGKDEVFDALIRAIEKVKGMKVKSSDKVTGQVVVKTSVSLASWGETVNLEVVEAGPQQATVRVSSKVKAQLVDWGKNQKNIDRIFAAMSEEMNAA